MAISVAGRNAAADGLADLVTRVSLHTADPGNAGTTSEVSGNAYARAATVGSAWTEASGVSQNNAVVQFATPSGAWGRVTHFALWAGNSFLISGSLTTAEQVNANADVRFAVGALRITVPAS